MADEYELKQVKVRLKLAEAEPLYSTEQITTPDKAAEVMALAAVYTMEQPELIEKARQELLRKNGGKYTCPLPEYVQPPIGRY